MTRLIVPLLFGLSGAAVLIWLGLWQVERLSWKEDILAEIDTRIAADPVPLPDAPNEEADKYLPVTVTGQFGEDALRVLVSQKRIGAGHLLISPLTTEGGRALLVDRGFLKLHTPQPDVPQGPVTITGNLHWPDDRNSSTPENDVAGNIWFARDINQMAQTLQTEPVLLIARSLSQPDGPVTPLPVDSSAIPNDHLQYAGTWFSLAFIWLVMTGYYIFRTRKAAQGDDA